MSSIPLSDIPTWKRVATAADATQHGLRQNEFEAVTKALGRDINIVELGICSALFSEHCSYKSTKVHLRTLPTKGARVIVGPGENACVVDIGDNEAVVFKVESHNHPSFIEPFQGAATGVGGILRDIFTMGARPIALLNSLRFGDPALAKSRYLLRRAINGIGFYGNCMGIPTVGGELSFHPSFNGNCLVNAFALGTVKQDEVFLGKAAGVGNVARLGAVGAASPGLGDSLFAVDVHGDGGVHHVLRIIDHHDVGPLTKHVGHTAENIQTGAAARAAEHTEVPTDAFAAGIVGVGLALEEHPSLPVYARIRVTIIDRALAVAGLVARRIEPRLNGERFVVLGVHRGVPGDFSAGGEIEEGGSARVAQDRAGHGLDSAQVLECCDSGGDARVEMVGAAHRAVAQAIVGSGSVGENRLRVVGRHCRGGQGGEASSSNAPNRSSDQVFHKEHLRLSQTRLRSGSVLSIGIGLLPDC